MWAVIKIDKKKICFLREELRRNFGEGSIIYSPKLLIEKSISKPWYLISSKFSSIAKL